MQLDSHISNFKAALLNVAPEYFHVPVLQGKLQIIERAFAYELYHQLRLSYADSNWYINGELRKGLGFFPEYKSESTLIPDLVIHEHGTTSQNIIAVEIKTNPKVTGAEIIKDLEKLEIYTNPRGLNYHIGILLIVNCDFEMKLKEMQPRNKKRIIELLGFHRIGVWNIKTPTPVPKTGINVQLESNCLKIFRANDFEIQN